MRNKDPQALLKRYAHRGNLTEGPIPQHLIRMTLPMIWGLAAVIAVQLADVYFIGLMKDTDILAGISFTFPITMLISHLVFGINIALSSVTARLIGAKQTDDAKRIVLHGLIMAFIASSIIALSTYIVIKPLFTLLGADADTYPAIADYMPLWLVASAILALPVNANSALRASGDTKNPAIVMSLIALINLIFDPLLIFGLGGFPEMGVTGAAMATLIGYSAGMILAFYIAIIRKKLVATDGLHLDQFKDSMKRLLIIAIPAGIGNIITPATGAMIIAILASHGSEAVAAYGIATRVEALGMLVVIALALGMAPIIGQNWGAEKFDRVHKTINLAIVFNLIWSALVAIILALFARPIASMFTHDAQVIHDAALFFWIVPFSFGIGNIVFGWSSAFNAMGKPQKAFIMIFVKSFALMVPAAMLGAHLHGITGLFCAIATSNIISGIAFHLLSNHQCRKEEQARLSGTEF
ncbi:MAG: MATE family efflux transporter [Rhodospirillales bacterium]|nr:MATE family efflux transporter [Rhodospirillales bacterium]